MEKQLLADTPIDKRADILRDTCYKVLENEIYTKQLSDEEIAERKTMLFEKVDKILSLRNELKEIKKNYSDRINALEAEKEELVQVIKFGAESKKGTLYAIDDQNKGIMGFYDSEGTLVFTRPLKPEERQISILTLKAGNDE